MTQPKPLTACPPRTAAIVAIIVEGPPKLIQIDLFNTTAGAQDRILARYTITPDRILEAATAFELLLSGTLWGQPHDMKGLELPHVGRT